MFDFDDDGDFDLIDLIEANIQYGLFEDEDKTYNKYSDKKQLNKKKSFWDWLKNY